MFGKKTEGGMPGEIDLGKMDFLRGGQEFARLWSEADGGMVCIIEPRGLGADPALFGMALVDAVHHGAKAYAQAIGRSEEDCLARIWAGFDAERENPTDEATQIELGE